MGYITETGALVSENDYNFLSDSQKEKCKKHNWEIDTSIPPLGLTMEEYWKQEFIKVVGHWFDKEQPFATDKISFINDKVKYAETIRKQLFHPAT